MPRRKPRPGVFGAEVRCVDPGSVTVREARAPQQAERTIARQDHGDEMPERRPRETFGMDHPWQRTRWRYLDEQDEYLTSGVKHFAIRFMDSRRQSFSLSIPRRITSRAMAEAVASELMHTALALSSRMVEDPKLGVTVEEHDGAEPEE